MVMIGSTPSSEMQTSHTRTRLNGMDVLAIFTLVIGPIVAPLLFLFVVTLPLFLQGDPRGLIYLLWAIALVMFGIPIGIFWFGEIFRRD